MCPGAPARGPPRSTHPPPRLGPCPLSCELSARTTRTSVFFFYIPAIHREEAQCTGKIIPHSRQCMALSALALYSPCMLTGEWQALHRPREAGRARIRHIRLLCTRRQDGSWYTCLIPLFFCLTSVRRGGSDTMNYSSDGIYSS